MELLDLWWAAITGGINVPLIAQLKKLWLDKVGTDLPALWFAVSVLLNVGEVLAINWALQLGLNMQQLTPYILCGLGVSFGGHSAFKTYEKNKTQTT